jgi:REP element-mobilizing transposase RayT
MEIKYNNLYTHFVFSTQDKLPAICEKHRERIEKYITGIVNHNDCRMYAVYANPEHLHMLVSRNPTWSEAALATVIADSSERFINANGLCSGRFQWQQSGSAFSVSKRDVDRVCKYILGQPEHHKKETFAQEYDKFIKFYQDTLSKHS